MANAEKNSQMNLSSVLVVVVVFVFISSNWVKFEKNFFFLFFLGGRIGSRGANFGVT